MLRHEHAPLCQNSDSFKIYKCQFSHTVPVDDESDSDSDSYTLDNESDQTKATTRENHTNPVRCNYGLCGFQTILFKTMSDFKTHLKNHHGIDK